MDSDFTKMNIENANYYGFCAQKDQLIEEMAELIQAMNKYCRTCGNRQRTELVLHEARHNVIEEIGDVEVMLQQIKYLMGINERAVEESKEAKILRTRARIEKKQMEQTKAFWGLNQEEAKEEVEQ